MGFNADPQQIATFSSNMKAKYDAINGMITRADSLAQNVNSPAFQGEAGRAFQNAMTDYLADARRMNQKLHEASDTVSTISSQISEEEVDNAKQILSATPLNMS